jgi:hypothetical protein
MSSWHPRASTSFPLRARRCTADVFARQPHRDHANAHRNIRSRPRSRAVDRPQRRCPLPDGCTVSAQLRAIRRSAGNGVADPFEWHSSRCRSRGSCFRAASGIYDHGPDHCCDQRLAGQHGAGVNAAHTGIGARARGHSGGNLAQGQTYLVVRGDTLSGIAARIGDRQTTINETAEAIFAANPEAFTRGDRNLLRAGHSITIPI